MLGTREKKEAVLTAFDGPLGHLEDHGGTVGLSVAWMDQEEFTRLARGGMDSPGKRNSALGSKS